MGIRTFSACAMGLALAAACGGSKFTAIEDAGVEGGVDAAPMCILPPNGVGNEGQFCSFYARHLSQCGSCESCRQLDENQCVALGSTLSQAAKDALVACEPTLGCDDLQTYAGSQCVKMHLMAVAPTMAQQNAKMAYCRACPQNAAQCSNFFNLGPDAGDTAGFGSWALLLNDTLATQVAMTCSGTNPKCDALTYGVCSALVFCGNNAAPRTNCPKGVCKN